jgi:hypothetical protein
MNKHARKPDGATLSWVFKREFEYLKQGGRWLGRSLIGRAALQHEAFIAIAAFGLAALINLQPDARMAQRRAARDSGRAVAGDAGGGDNCSFGLDVHDRGFSSAGLAFPAYW